MTICAIDIGNTSVKATLFFEGKPLKKEVFTTLDEIFKLHSEGKWDAAVFCTTRTLTDKEIEEIGRRGWWEFKWGCKMPLEVEYESPCTLGTDRLAAAIGAWNLCPSSSLLVVDAGTALTIDVVRDNKYLGGNISPGLAMRFRALHSMTSRLPLINEKENIEKSFFGKDTETAIGCGVVWGMAAEIAGMMQLGGRSYESRILLLTGGDGKRMYSLIERIKMNGCRVVYDPDLVAKGLYKAYCYNHEI